MPDTRPANMPDGTARHVASNEPPDARNAMLPGADEIGAIRELLRALAVAHTNGALYSPAHPLVKRSLDEFLRAMDGLVALGFRHATINIYKETLFVQGRVFPVESVTYRRLIEALLARGISALTVSPPVTASDLTAVVDVLLDTTISGVEQATAYLGRRGVRTITVAETSRLEGYTSSRRDSKAAARSGYDMGVSVMRDVEMQCKLGRLVDLIPLQRVVTALLDTLVRDPDALLGLTAMNGHDQYTLTHSVNACILSLYLGAALNLDETSLRSLGLSALLFDVGKVRVPQGILAKKGPLTHEEWGVVRSHAEEGADLLKNAELVDHMPMVVAYEHHQRHDLRGYPASVARQEQHLFSKVVAVADAYDAMTTRRPFRREIRPDMAHAVLMQGRGRAYDPDIVKTFTALLGIFPMGAVVTLDDGSTAVVYRVNNEDLLRPNVKILIDPTGRWLEEPQAVDLRADGAGPDARSILTCVPAAEAGVDDVWEYL